MDVNKLTPFIDGLKTLLEQYEVTDIKKGKLEKKPNLNAGSDVNVIIGYQKDMKANVTYSMSFSTAQNIVSAMMGGVPVTEFDENVESGICEFANMVSGYTVTSFFGMKLNLENTPPTLVTGKKLFLMIGRVETVMLEVVTPVGNIEINIGVEQ